MERWIKTIPIYTRADNPSGDLFWEGRVFEINHKKYIPKLFVFDEYDGYLAQWKVYRVGPEFDTKEEASQFILDNWMDAVL